MHYNLYQADFIIQSDFLVLILFYFPSKKCQLISAEKGKKKDSSSGEITDTKKKNGGQQIVEVNRGEYRLPLVWIDLEMTGEYKDTHCLCFLFLWNGIHIY